MGKQYPVAGSWKGLASKLQSKLESLGLELREEDRHVLGDLQDLDLRCQTLPELIEALAQMDGGPAERDEFGRLVARLWAEVTGLKQCSAGIEVPLKHLLSAIHK